MPFLNFNTTQYSTIKQDAAAATCHPLVDYLESSVYMVMKDVKDTTTVNLYANNFLHSHSKYVSSHLI